MIIDVSIIIVNYNTCELTKQSIDSVFEKTSGISFEVIVVDNDSKDDSIMVLSKDSRVNFIESGANLGFGRANNLGIKHSRGKYVFFLNSDTILLNNAIKMLFDFMEAHKKLKVGALGTILLDANHNRTHSYGNLQSCWDILKIEWGDHLLKRFGKRMARYDEGVVDPDAPYFQVGYVTGADLFCSRETIDLAGDFDPDFFMYWEESEMQHRWSKKLGASSYIIRGPRIVHLEGKSGNNKSIMSSLKKMPSMFMYVKKTHNSFEYYMFRALMLVGRLHQIILPILAKEEKKYLLNCLLHKY